MRARTRAMCGRTCACACEFHSEKCARCACVRLVFGRAMCDGTLHTFWNKTEIKWHFFCLKNYSWTALEHLFLLWNFLSCFGTFFPALECPTLLEHLIFFENLLKFLWKITKGAGAKCDHLKLEVRTRVRAFLNLDVRGACVRRKKWSQPMPCRKKPLKSGRYKR